MVRGHGRAAGYSTLVVLLAVLLTPLEADVRVPAQWRWVTDAPVSASVSAGDVAYLGGRFKYIAAVAAEGPSFLDQGSGLAAAGCATRSGTQDGVRPVTVPDPAGGLFMQVPLPPDRLVDGAGVFDVPPSASFVRIGADCRFVRTFRLDAFVPADTSARGLTILRAGDTIYVGGTRTAGFAEPVAWLASFDGTTGARRSAAEFTQFSAILLEGSAPGGRLVISAADRGSTGASYRVGALNPVSGGFTELAQVDANAGFVRVQDTTLYVSQTSNSALRAIDLATGTSRAGWQDPSLTVTDIEVADGRVFVAGSGLGRTGVFAVSEATGALVASFAPALTADSGEVLAVERLALVGSRLFVRGRTVRALNGEARYLLAAVSTSTGAFDPWAPTVFAPTTVSVDLVPLDTRLYIGRVIGAPLQRRTHLAAVNVVTGAVMAFDPNGRGTSQLVPPVTSLAANDDFLFAGTSLGQIRRVDLLSGLADAWTVLASTASGAQGYISSVVATPTRLYAGGYFNQVATSTQPQAVTRGHGLAVDIASVQVTAWDPRVVSASTSPTTAPRPLEALALVDAVVVTGGNFSSAGGQARVGLAALNAESGVATLPGVTLPAGSRVEGLTSSGARVFFVGSGTGGSRLIGVADTVADAVVSWAVAGNPDRWPSSRVAYVDGLVYSGPAWDADTGTATPSTTYWTRPAASTGGLLELQVPLDGVTGPTVSQFHSAGEPVSPTAPRNLTVQHANLDVFLSWTAPASGSVTSYVVRAGSASGQSNLFDFDTGSTAATLLGTAPEGVYYVRVHARSAQGLTGPSNEIAFALAPFGCNAVPRAPGSLSASGFETTASLAWSGAIGAGSYVVEAGSAPSRADLARLDVGRNLRLDTIAPPGTYHVRVRGLNACGEGPASNEAVVQVGGPPPEPATDLRVAVTASTVVLEWNAPGTGPVPLFYRLEAGSQPGLTDLATVNTGALTYTATGVPPGTYFVRARSGNAAGYGPATPEVTVVVPPLR